MAELLRISALLAVLLLIPVVPFVLFGAGLEREMVSWFDQSLSPPVMAAAIFGILATDIFLPVPSSFVSTLAGAQLGVIGGTVTVWLGMTVGAAGGFWIARRGGPPLAKRLAGADDFVRVESLAQRRGPELLVLTRAVPVLAEASVLLMGTTQLTWRRFLPPIALSNLGIAAVYALFGQWALQMDALFVALAASVVVPLAAALLVRLRLPVSPAEA